MSEIINTSNFTLYPECSVVLEIIRVTKQTKKDNPSVVFYRWDFNVRMSDNENIINDVNFLFFPNQMGDLFRAIGAEEKNKDVFEMPDDWKTNLVVGKLIKADIIHTIFRGETKHALANIEAYVEDTSPEPKSMETAWDEDK